MQRWEMPVIGIEEYMKRQSINYNPEDSQMNHSFHGGHHWMMLICCIPMVLVVAALVVGGALNPSWVIVAFLCVGMMAFMMKIMTHDSSSHHG